MNRHRINSQVDFVLNHEHDFLTSNDDELYIIPLENTEVVYGRLESCNIDYCKKHNIRHILQGELFTGGCIVGVSGNIFIDYKKIYKDTDFTQENIVNDFAKALCHYFKSKGLNSVRQDNNDVLIDGYKVASGCRTHYPQGNDYIQYMGYQISIYQDLELIKNVCNKKMEKVPKALSEYGITTEEMIEFCKNYWKD